MTDEQTNELMTIAQCAELLQVSKRTIERYIERGALPAYRLNGSKKSLRIKRTDIYEKFLQRIEPDENELK